jgi:hypothetical protein
MPCSRCGHENRDDARHCANCGYLLADGGPAQPPDERRDDPPRVLYGPPPRLLPDRWTGRVRAWWRRLWTRGR